MGRNLEHDSYPWASTDKNITTAKSLMSQTNAVGDYCVSMTREGWHDGLGRYFIHRKPSGIYYFRDWAPGCAICNPYVIDRDWHPNDDDKKAVDWHVYG